VELGRIDIITEVSMFSTHFCLLREGHLDATFYLCAYFALYQNVMVMFDPT
jgi:hypothetical protein